MRFMLFAVAVFSFGFLNATQEIESPPEEKQVDVDTKTHTFLLPVNWISTPKLNMAVTVSAGYRSVQPLSTFTNGNSDMIEFIPEGEVVAKWSEIITVQKIVGRSIPAKGIVEEIRKGILRNVKGEVLVQSATDHKGYERAELLLEYFDNGITEVLGMVYASGPYDCAGVQYTIRVQKDQSVDAAVQKVQQFLKNQAAIIEF